MKINTSKKLILIACALLFSLLLDSYSNVAVKSDPIIISIKPVSVIKLANLTTTAPTIEETTTFPQVVAQAPAAVHVGGNCSTWIANAGISDTQNAMRLLNMESGCNPYAVNKSSGACGLAQELPCGKSGCSLGDGQCEMIWFNSYVISRYGSMAGAVQFHLVNNWY
ncbi:MAG TPA: hypothetical protein VN081_01585 [Dongiaceae bacterium]|nr:hypothetical protein [Dongiaceae bacterium]